MRTTKNTKNLRKLVLYIGILLLGFSLPQTSFAHCDSYDGPVIKDALLALEVNNVDLILKWIEPQHEKEIIDLFNKTRKYKSENKEVNELLEKHFLETLVRVHREGEGEPFTGLKPAGSTTPIVMMADNSLENEDFDNLSKNLSRHMNNVLKEKYDKAMELGKVKNESEEKGRAYVAAYVDYTHTLEAIHAIIEHGVSHAH